MRITLLCVEQGRLALCPRPSLYLPRHHSPPGISFNSWNHSQFTSYLGYSFLVLLGCWAYWKSISWFYTPKIVRVGLWPVEASLLISDSAGENAFCTCMIIPLNIIDHARVTILPPYELNPSKNKTKLVIFFCWLVFLLGNIVVCFKRLYTAF